MDGGGDEVEYGAITWTALVGSPEGQQGPLTPGHTTSIFHLKASCGP